ncbi:hypothetical protein EGT07_02945 [Herbaspirillum sp. HC18]|nr:hypothetical protein EGT07_02945 [Herbaspirillum sp. HC18]
MTEKTILDNPVLHEQLCVSSCILAELLRHAPRALSAAQLEKTACHPAEQVEQVCRKLSQHGLLRPDPALQGHWMLGGSPSSITLADLFAALLPGDRTV